MKNIIEIIFLFIVVTVFITCTSSPKQQREEDVKSDTTKQATSEIKTEDEEYEQIYQEDSLIFGLTDVTGTTTIGADGSRDMTGTFGSLTCNGKSVDVITNDILSGYISTKSFGKIKISTGTFGGLMVYLKPSQKVAFKKLFL